ncbi:hypothetical protein [Pseudomonas citronellolis]|uniref:hypothetical protein n=1 Tax=Pseudomonas citronellolis TaxID=53408 RepID=UPI002FDB7FAD
MLLSRELALLPLAPAMDMLRQSVELRPLVWVSWPPISIRSLNSFPLFIFLYSDTCKKRHEYGVDRKQGRFFLLRKALAMTPNCKGSVKRYLIFLENERRSALADTRDRSCKIWIFLIGQVPAYCFSKSAAPSGSSNYTLQRMPGRRGLRRQPALGGSFR